MICSGAVEAACLPEPYALEARLLGNVRNFSTRGLEPQLGAYLVPTSVARDSSRARQLQLLFQGYHEAVELANQPHGLRDSLPQLLKELCLTPDSLCDTIVRLLPPFTPLYRPAQSDANAALRWLRSRGKADNRYNTDTLILEIHGLESIR